MLWCTNFSRSCHTQLWIVSFLAIFVLWLTLYTHSMFQFREFHKLRRTQFTATLNTTEQPTVALRSKIIKGVAEKYFVNTSTCHIPYIEPFNAEIMQFYKPRSFISCSNESDLVTVHFDVYQKSYVLHINEAVLHQLLNSTEEDYICFYQKIVYGQQADTYDGLNRRVYFWQNYAVPSNVEGLLLECQNGANTLQVLQRDAYIFIQHQEPKQIETDYTEAPIESPPRKPSVIMFGIDTLSRINLRRTMPVVYEYLKGPGWYEMQGYTKVADNSFPNIFSILTGYSPETAKAHICDTDKEGCLDKIPFIWKYFNDASYLTAYAEDESASNTFSYLKPGFTKKPTDYYFRPFLRALEEELQPSIEPKFRMQYCLGRRLANSYIYDYCRQFMQRYLTEQPIWGMFWSNHFSHDDYFMPSAMQHKILADLLSYESDGAFEHTIMIFFADHGARFGVLQNLEESFLEERSPMLFIYLPPWFREKYPKHAHALEQNQQLLSSNFDLHNTLKHLIELGNLPYSEVLPKSFDCPSCQSLLEPIPENRTCSEAGIAEHYCACQPYRRLNHYAWSERIAPRVAERINEYLWGKGLKRLCSNLTILDIIRTEIKVDFNYWMQLPETDIATYRTKFVVHQNRAEFEATVIFNNITEAIDVNVELISRTNEYEKDATCVDEKIVKLYCICFKDLKAETTKLQVEYQDKNSSTTVFDSDYE